MLFNEAFVYTLDATPMFLAILVLSAMHPGRVLLGPDSEFPRLSRKEKKMRKEEKKALKRERKDLKRQSKNGGDTKLEA
jgi:tRNA pseudouridine-54 N-methylase